ncbi:MAG: exonuclease subunit SbcD, partial [Eubacteriales bacterium]|nr:exonuclease subunit SbcD [Eubacteriales bacterium]
IAGDIYDTINPPVMAERLFFNAMKRLSLNGKRPILIISGNHDSSNRLTSSKPLAYEFGIILQGEPNSIANIGKYDGFEITKAGEGFFEIEINNEKAVFLTMPYPTEKNLNEIIFTGDEENQQKSFSNKIKDIFEELSKNFKDDTINIIVSHLFITGGIESDSERKIQTIGGTYAVDSSVFPEKTDYVALGHLHRMQKIKANCLAYYSGSPIRYSQSEVGYEKCVLVLDIKPKQEPILKKIPLTDYKPINIFKCDSYEKALEMCQKNKDTDSYVFIEITSETALTGEEIRLLRETKKDIISIIVKFNKEEKVIYEVEEEKSILEQFNQFYFDKNNTNATDELLDTFLKILNEIESEEVETNETENS